jgi:hypothetical protein
MPGGDGTGPIGRGPMTGRDYGFCMVENRAETRFGFGPRLGCRQFWKGYRRNLSANPGGSLKKQKELLAGQKKMLENRLEIIKRQLESFPDTE